MTVIFCILIGVLVTQIYATVGIQKTDTYNLCISPYVNFIIFLNYKFFLKNGILPNCFLQGLVACGLPKAEVLWCDGKGPDFKARQT